MYVCHSDARSPKHRCREKAIGRPYYTFHVGVDKVNPANKPHLLYAALYCHIGLRGCDIFFILSHKRRDFRENVIEYKMGVLTVSINLSETFLILRKTE
jgi:hypothetical protein